MNDRFLKICFLASFLISFGLFSILNPRYLACYFIGIPSIYDSSLSLRAVISHFFLFRYKLNSTPISSKALIVSDASFRFLLSMAISSAYARSLPFFMSVAVISFCLSASSRYTLNRLGARMLPYAIPRLRLITWSPICIGFFPNNIFMLPIIALSWPFYALFSSISNSLSLFTLG